MASRAVIRSALVGGVLCGLVLTGCAPSPTLNATPADVVSQPSAVSSESASPSESPSETASAGAEGPADAEPSISPPSQAPAPAAPVAPVARPHGKNHSEAAASWAYPAVDVQRWLRHPGQGAQPANKTVFLTFDDGPSAITAQVLDVLKAKGVHATFFIIGAQIAGHENLIHRILAEGHALAIHTFSHRYGYLYPGRFGNTANIISDRNKAVEAVRKVVGEDYFSSAYRYPGGHVSWKGLGPSDAALEKEGVYWLDWNAMTGDAEPAATRATTVEAMTAMASLPLPSKKQVVVLLAHDAHDKPLTPQALPSVIDAYQRSGYSFGIIS